MNEYQCNKCGWVHFGVTREEAEAQVNEFNTYFDSLSWDQQLDNYGGKRSAISSYEHCFACGNVYTDFRPAVHEAAPIGCTLGPIIVDEYKLSETEEGAMWAAVVDSAKLIAKGKHVKN